MTTTEIRIDGCLRNIEKTQKTLERHQSRLAKKITECQKVGISSPQSYERSDSTTDKQYWAMCDYHDAQDAVNNTTKKLQELRTKLEGYRAKKAEEDKKNNVPMVPAVEEFLKNWKAQADEYYRNQVQLIHKWKADYKTHYDQQMQELEAKFGYRVHCFDKEVEAEKKARNVNWDYKDKTLKQMFTQDCLMLANLKPEEFDLKLNDMLDSEVDSKRVDLYHRCSAVVGVITDATGLKSGKNGSINGIVIGEDGKAEVETILAGGYNIQCLHYRVLVKPLK